MRTRIAIVFSLICASAVCQIKDDISVVQFSASFVKGSEISLESFTEINKETIYISDYKKAFENENIKYLPTIIVYQDGEEVKRIESGINLKLPDGCLNDLQLYVSELLEARF